MRRKQPAKPDPRNRAIVEAALAVLPPLVAKMERPPTDEESADVVRGIARVAWDLAAAFVEEGVLRFEK